MAQDEEMGLARKVIVRFLLPLIIIVLIFSAFNVDWLAFTTTGEEAEAELLPTSFSDPPEESNYLAFYEYTGILYPHGNIDPTMTSTQIDNYLDQKEMYTSCTDCTECTGTDCSSCTICNNLDENI